MVYKLGHIVDLQKFTLKDEAVWQVVFNCLEILDKEYGENRDVDINLGGYVLYCTAGTSDRELSEFFNYNDFIYEYVKVIETTPCYCSVLYVTSSDYAVLVVMACDDARKIILKENEND